MKADIASPAAPFSRRAQVRGLVCMVVASLMFSLMNVCVYAIGLCEPQLPAAVVSFVRILINLSILLVPAVLAGSFLGLFGDFRLSLWLRGLFGSLALMSSFASIQMIGPGESAFLAASSGIFVALLGPKVLKQNNSALGWLAILGAMAGLALLFEPRLGGGGVLGRALALGTGFLAALAYLMVAKAGTSNATASVIFYFCLIGTAIHLAYFGYFGFSLPASVDVWILLGVGGVSASIAQFYMTLAYQTAPAALVSAAGYLSPVLSLAWGVLLFSRTPDALGLVGCALVLLFGVMLPFVNVAGKQG
jgi:drug/metabolite transporter (DMT)-like permease